MIKILIGGSPCTFWSIAQKNGRETEAEGMGWELFKNYLIARDKFKPDLFLYENNKSAAQPIKDQISRELCVDLMYINSSLVSAQNRQRFYAFNWEVEQPEDRGIVLRDILDTEGASGVAVPVNTTENGDKSRTIMAGYYKYGTATLLTNGGFKGGTTCVSEPVRVGCVPSPDGTIKNSQGMRIYSVEGKSVNITAQGGGLGAKTGLYAIRVDEPLQVKEATKQGYVDINVGDCVDLTHPNSKTRRGRSCQDKSNCLTTSCQLYEYCGILGYATPCEWDEDGMPTKAISCADGKTYTVYEVKDGQITIKGKQYSIKLVDGYYIIRKLTPIECERLQTLPDNYTEGVSDSQRYKGLGNGWTAEVIIHILNGALKDIPRDEEIVVLSMYDGIGTGRYCLDKMGFTNVKYFAYEIDKYAKQIAMKNYPDIIQMGDAFDLRHPDWTIGY